MLSLCDALILGGGLGTRFQASGGDHAPKQFLPINGVPVFVHAVRGLLRTERFRRFVLVFPEAWMAEAQRLVDISFPVEARARIEIVPGGNRRQDSSWRGLSALAALSPPPSRVIIHDACRPYLSEEFLGRVVKCLDDRSYAAWAPGISVSDTLKRVNGRQVIETVPRDGVFRIQTPQIFEFEVIRSLTERTLSVPDAQFTDDASVCEYYGIPVGVIEGDARNIKLTYAWELEILRALLGTSS